MEGGVPTEAGSYSRFVRPRTDASDPQAAQWKTRGGRPAGKQGTVAYFASFQLQEERKLEMRLDVERTENGLAIGGELDLSTSPQLDQALEEAAASGDDIVLDVKDLTFIDSTGLRVLLGTIESLPETRRLILRGTQPQVVRVFKIAGILGKVENLVVEGAEQPES